MKTKICLYEAYKLYELTLIEEIGHVNYHDLSFIWNDAWYVRCLNGLKFIDGEVFKPLEYGLMELKREGVFYKTYLFAYKDNNEYYAYHRENFLISSIEEAELVSEELYLKDKHVFFENSKFKSDIDFIYLNQKKYKGEIIKDFDRVNIFGLTLFFVDDLIFSNDHKLKNKLRVYNDDKIEPYFDERILINKLYNPKVLKPLLNYELKLINENSEYKSNFALTFMQGLFMSLGMLLVAGVNAYLSYKNGRSLLEISILVAMPLIMAIVSIVFPLLLNSSRKKEKRNLKKDLNLKNKTIIDDLENNIKTDLEKLKKYYGQYYFAHDDFKRIMAEALLFQRNRDDEDFLYLNIGFGDICSTLAIKGDNNDKTKEIINDLKRKYEYLKNEALIIDLKKDPYITIKSYRKRDEIFLYILLELVLLHSYEDLKIVLLVDEAFINKYPYISEIPQLYHDDKRYLFKEKVDNLKYDKDTVILSFYPYFETLEANNYFIYFNEDMTPKPTSLILEYSDSRVKVIKGESKKVYRSSSFVYDDFIFYKLRKYRFLKSENSLKEYELTDLFSNDIGLLKNYKETKIGIRAVMGYSDEGLLEFDLSEKGIGPHGLIGGSTGSGKSEFILSMIISLCLRYSAEELNINLIDYKGTGLEEALSYKGKRIPHLSLSLTNLDEVSLNRSLASFKLECERREILFQKLAKLTHSSIMNLEDYHRLNPKSYGLPYIATQLIVIDEFAELKSERPDFLKDIISIARIGRSLGIMLILITQKPSAVVDQEIWANSAYKIALRVQDESDSKELIKSNIASKIKRPGEFYLSYQDKLIHGYGLYSRAPLDPRLKQKVSLLNENLKVLKVNEFKDAKEERQLSHFVKLVIDHHKQHNIKSDSLYLDSLKEKDFISLYKKYNIKLKSGELLLGEYDDFKNMKQDVLIHNLNKEPYIAFSFIENERRDLFFNHIITSLALFGKDYDLVLIGDANLYDYEDYLSKISYIAKSDIEYLLYRLNHKLERKLVLFIDDYLRFIQDDDIRTSFEKALIRHLDNNLIVIAAMRNKINLSFKLDNIFFKYVIDYHDKESLFYAFNMNEAVSEKSVFLKDKSLVGFKMPKLTLLNKKPKKSLDFIKQIPELIKAEVNLLGYDQKRREKFYVKGDKKILFCAYYREALDRFKSKFKYEGDFDFKILSEVNRDSYYDELIWIGPGILNQYLFIPKIKRDLNIFEAYLSNNDEYGVITYVNE